MLIITGFSIDNLIEILVKIAGKLPVTLTIMALSLFFGLVLGLVIAMVRIRHRPVSYAIATFYLSVMRCTPALVQLFLIFFGLPHLLMLLNIDINGWNKVTFVVIAFSLHMAASLSEVIRSAYLAVGSGQLESSYSVGMSYLQALRRIVLPQAFAIALPNLGNDCIILLKDTSLAFTIGIVDIMGEVRIIVGNNYGINEFQVYLVISLIYWAISIAIENGVSSLDKRLNMNHVSISKY